MIKLNNKIVKTESFPDGTLRLLDFNLNDYNLVQDNANNVTWCYENDSEMFVLLCIKRHIDTFFYKRNAVPLHLLLAYCPNARMDRVKSENEVFTLKYFCEFINSLNFDSVYIFDAHSNVTEALINGYKPFYVSNVIKDVINITSFIENKTLKPVIYFPDDGAYKRYKDLDCFKGYEFDFIYGKKNRDWKTGQILGLEVCDPNGKILDENVLKGKTVLMIDDIISYGGTLAYSADKLKSLGAEEIYVYASHTENSILDKEKGTLLKRLENNVVNKIYTTNSLYTGTHDKIIKMAIF